MLELFSCHMRSYSGVSSIFLPPPARKCKGPRAKLFCFENGLTVNKIFSGSVLGPPGSAGPRLHGRVCRGGSYAPALLHNH